jgi:hypothetical protein
MILKNIHLLPTDKPSRLLKTMPKGNLLLHKEKIVGSHWENQNIYITNSEEIKKDWCIDIEDNTVFKVKEQGHSGLLRSATDSFVEDSCKKIILTTDQDLIKDGVQAIDDDFLDWFVKNASCQSVEVRSEKIILGEVAGTTYTDFNYKIIIPKKEVFGKYGSLWHEDVEKTAMDKLKSKWEHLYKFGYPKKPFPTNYENDLNNVKIGLYEGLFYWGNQKKIKIRVANEHVEHVLKSMAEYNPVAVDLPDFLPLPCVEEFKDIEFDLEAVTTEMFLSRLFFAGIRHGIKSMRVK